MIYELPDRLAYLVVFFIISELMVKRFLYTIICFILVITSSFAEVEVAFTPSDECENKITNLIDNSERSIDIAVYSINNQRIVEALNRANQRKITLRILTDRLQASSKYSKVTEMHTNGLNVRVHTKNKIEHNKFAIFDGKIVSTGSYNWTNAASDKNSENCLFLQKDPETVKTYQDQFELLWKENTQEKSEQWFEKRRNKNGTNNKSS